jgi:MFS family permease
MKINKIVSILIVLLAVVSFVLYYQIVQKGHEQANSQLDAILNLTLALLYITAGLAVLGWFVDIFSDKKAFKYTMISLTGFGLVVALAYFKADGGEYHLGDIAVSASTSKWVDTGLWTFYFLAVIALAMMLFSWISDFFKSS